MVENSLNERVCKQQYANSMGLRLFGPQAGLGAPVGGGSSMAQAQSARARSAPAHPSARPVVPTKPIRTAAAAMTVRITGKPGFLCSLTPTPTRAGGWDLKGPREGQKGCSRSREPDGAVRGVEEAA